MSTCQKNDPSINPPTHLHTKPYTHSLVGKSTHLFNLLNLYGFQRVPLGSLGGCWVSVRVDRVSPTLVYICRHMHTYICTHIPVHVNHDKHGCFHGSGHLQSLNMKFLVLHACACMHKCTNVCVHVWEYFWVPRYSPTHLPHPPGAKEAQIIKTL